MESSHSLARVLRLLHPHMAVAHDSRAAGDGGGCGQEPPRLPHCSTKNRMCSGSALCGRGCPIADAYSSQMSYRAGHRAMVSESLVPQLRGEEAGSLSAALAWGRLMGGGDGMLVGVAGTRGRM